VPTLDRLLEEMVAGQEEVIGITIRQHGRTPLGGQSVGLTFVHQASGQRVWVAATDDERVVGHYQARVTLPHSGEWHWTISAWQEHQMPPLAVRPAATSATAATVKAVAVPAAMAAVDRAGSRTQLGWLLLGLASGLGLIGLGCLWLAWRPRRPAQGWQPAGS
jgi:hypothetical protein